MLSRTSLLTLLGLSLTFVPASTSALNAAVIVSGYLANPAGTDSPHEYVQLTATSNIDFSVNNYSVVFANTGAATLAGWTAGGAVTYGFNLTSGMVTLGQTFYVGGSARLINGAGSTDISSETWIRTINTLTNAGDGFGNAVAGGVLGNGGTNADGIGVFNVLTSAITNSTTPVDAVFFGTGPGSAATSNYQVPSNDVYAGGVFGTVGNTTLFADPASANFVQLTGTFNTGTSTWTTPRTSAAVLLTATSSISAISSGITVTAVPEPSSMVLVGLIGVGGMIYRTRLRNQEKVSIGIQS